MTITAHGQHGLDTFRLRRPDPSSPTIRVETDTPNACHLPRMVSVPELDPAQRVAAALESSRVDPPFQNAMPIAMWLMEQTV